MSKKLFSLLLIWGMILSVFVISLIVSLPNFERFPIFLMGTIAYSIVLYEVILSMRFTFFKRRYNLTDVYKVHGVLGILLLLIVIMHSVIGFSKFGYSSSRGTIFFGFAALLSLILIVSTGIVSLSSQFIKNRNIWIKNKRSKMLIIHRLAIALSILIYLHMLSINDLHHNILFLFITGIALMGTLSLYFREKIAVAKLSTLSLTEHKKVSPYVHQIDLTSDGNVTYDPGQYFFLRFQNSKLSKEAHPFSYSSWSSRTVQAFIKESGDFTKQLSYLRTGDKATVEGPFGALFPKKTQENDSPLVMIAGGIGITPFLSILDWLTEKGSHRKILLLWSVSYSEELFLLERIKEYESALPSFKFVVTITREQTDRYETGRISSDTINKYSDDQMKNSGVFLVCGPLSMVDSMNQILYDCEIEKERIHSEKFNY